MRIFAFLFAFLHARGVPKKFRSTIQEQYDQLDILLFDTMSEFALVVDELEARNKELEKSEQNLRAKLEKQRSDLARELEELAEPLEEAVEQTPDQIEPEKREDSSL